MNGSDISWQVSVAADAVMDRLMDHLMDLHQLLAVAVVASAALLDREDPQPTT